jgi:hypothetical protein
VARRLIGDADHFWQKRYHDFKRSQSCAVCRETAYIHWNPVKKGLCERAEDWPWSSFLHHATGGEGRVEIESEWTARLRERAAGRLCPGVEVPPRSEILASHAIPTTTRQTSCRTECKDRNLGDHGHHRSYSTLRPIPSFQPSVPPRDETSRSKPPTQAKIRLEWATRRRPEVVLSLFQVTKRNTS